MWFYVRNPFLRRVLLVVFLDLSCFAAAGFAARSIAAPEMPLLLFTAAIAVAAGGLVLALQATGAYDLGVLGDGRRTLSAVVATMGIGMAAGLVFYFVVPAPPGTKGVLAHGAAMFFPAMLLTRLVFRTVSRQRLTRILLVGTSDLSFAISEAIGSRSGLGLEVVGLLSDDPDHQGASLNGVEVVGKIHNLEKVILADLADSVVMASQSREEHFPSDQLLQLKLRGFPVESGIELYERISGEIYLRNLRSSQLIFSEGFRLGRIQAFAKRCLDVGFALTGLAVAAPVLLLGALAIRLDSRGPILYRQTRLGQFDRPIELLKLRSMSHEAEQETGPVFASRNDPRITRVGRFLRRTRIDELPQLWNVLRGDMSVVGPRPERPEFVERISQRFPYFRYRSMCKPGVTGWAQSRLGYVSEIDGFERKLALDLYYLKHRSFSLDLSIIWSTVRTVVTLSGV